MKRNEANRLRETEKFLKRMRDELEVVVRANLATLRKEFVTKNDLKEALENQNKIFKEEIENTEVSILENIIKHVAMKEDLKGVAMKDDLKNLATKEEMKKGFQNVESRLDKIELDITDIKRDVNNIKADFVTGQEFRDFKEELKN